MAIYMIGDVQGCNAPLQHLLQTLDFSASRDTAYLLGDLVNRGPDSLGVLRWAKAAGTSARCILGNHDLHLLGVALGVRKAGKQDTLDDVLRAPDRTELCQWLRQQPLARLEHGWLMVHAGVLPQWTTKETIALSTEISSALSGFDHMDFFKSMYGNAPAQWHDGLRGADRLRVVVNALTRLRYCTADGAMEFDSKDTLGSQPANHMAWFDVPGRMTTNQPIAFGHWSTLRGLQRPNLLALDTGCVWGGCLSAARLEPTATPGETAHHLVVERVPCPRAKKPGPPSAPGGLKTL